MVDARLEDGSRVNAIIPPLALNGPVLSIRRFGVRLGGEDLLSNRTMPPEMLTFLKAAVEARVSILISGGTGSGKTTLLNALSQYIPGEERLITIEDAAELKLQQRHVVGLETKTANVEGTGQILQRDLVRNALRMRPDRIIVGEVRGGEALDMLQAMNTGHEGSLTTIHANDTRDALTRLEMMVMMAGFELPVPVIRYYITTAITLVVQLARLKGGKRKVVRVTEVLGTDPAPYDTEDIFGYRQLGVRNGAAYGEFYATGYRPKVLERLNVDGCRVAFGNLRKTCLGRQLTTNRSWHAISVPTFLIHDRHTECVAHSQTWETSRDRSHSASPYLSEFPSSRLILAIRSVSDKRRESDKRLIGAPESGVGLVQLSQITAPDKVGSRSKFDTWFEVAVDRSGLEASPAGVIAVMILLATILGSGLYFWKGQLGLAGLGVVLGLAVPFAVVAFSNRSYRKKLQDQIPDAFRMIAGSVRAGQSLEQAIEFYAEQGTRPLADEFAHCASLMRLGMSPAAASLRPPRGFDCWTSIFSSRPLGFTHRQVGIWFFCWNGWPKVFGIATSSAGNSSRLPLSLGSSRSPSVLSLRSFCSSTLLAEPEHVQTFLQSPSGWGILVGCAIMEVIGVIWLWWILRIDY